jgi:hypothetical protein
MRRIRVSPAMVVALIALIAATAGTALAATGQLVNIVDPSNAGYAAKVDKFGSLSVLDRQRVSFSRSEMVPNFYSTGTQTTILQTTASLQISRMQLAVEDVGSSPWIGAVFYQAGDAQGNCNGAETRIAVESARPGDTHLDQLSEPLQLKSDVAGHTWCLKVSFGPIDASTDSDAFFDVSGTVLVGRLTPANAAPPADAPQKASPTSPTGG